MSTVIRPVVSDKNRYRISKHRYYELKHFCLQYPEWRDQYVSLSGNFGYSLPRKDEIRSNHIPDTTAEIAITRSLLKKNMDLVDDVIAAADGELGFYLKKAVTEGISFVNLKSRYSIPCERDMFYNRYRKFFWLLSRAKD